MALYKRGTVYWYTFVFQGKRFQGSTKLRNIRKAETFVTTLKSNLALGRIGIRELKPGPALQIYAEDFKKFIAIHNKKRPRTIGFYEEKLKRLLEFKPLAETRISEIDEKLIQQYVEHRATSVGPGSINRELATLRKALRIAWKTHKLISGVPSFLRLPGEVERDFVLSYEQEKAYLAQATATLRDFAILSLDTGVRAGEGASLAWEDVHLESAPNAKLGYIFIREGKSKNARRILSITPRVKTMLANRRRFNPEGKYVFPGIRKGTHVLVSSLGHLHIAARQNTILEDGKVLPKTFVLHSLRHTFGTRLGLCPDADAFTIMRIMGHSSVMVSQKYVHPTPARLERAFEQLETMNAMLRGEARPEVPTVSTTGAMKG
jgi:integrase